MKIVISSGHGKYISGAVGPAPWGLNEHAEAVHVVDMVAEYLEERGVAVVTFEDTVSHSQDENLKRICDFHNAQGAHDYDVSVHFNANVPTSNPVGTECWHMTQPELAAKVAAAIGDAGHLLDRGAKHSSGLYFLKHTVEPAILIEVCFVDSSADAQLYRDHFSEICEAIAGAIGGERHEQPPVTPPAHQFYAKGKMSTFGGPADTGVSPSEGLAFISSIEQVPQLFLPMQPPSTTGLARRLNPFTHYAACRWDYAQTPQSQLRTGVGLARAKGMELKFMPADWGPNENTGRIADLSPSLADDLKLTTDDEVEIIFPAPGTTVLDV